jgi:hypothetical protein
VGIHLVPRITARILLPTLVTKVARVFLCLLFCQFKLLSPFVFSLIDSDCYGSFANDELPNNAGQC